MRVPMERGHTDREYENELGELRERLLLMSGRVEGMLARGMTALLERDSVLAGGVIADDLVVDRDEVEIDRLCMEILARRQPMASDLRFVTRALKMVTDLERIGDYASHMAQRALDWGPGRAFTLPEELPRMSELGRGMLKDAVDSLIRRDIALSEAVIGRDEAVNVEYQQVQRTLVEEIRDGRLTIDDGMRVQKLAKYCERIADHATNVAEQVIYVLNGEDVRTGVGARGGCA